VALDEAREGARVAVRDGGEDQFGVGRFRPGGHRR